MSIARVSHRHGVDAALFGKTFRGAPTVAGTALVSAIAMVVALPAGLLAAIYLSEYAPSQLRRIVKPLLEILAESLRSCMDISLCCL